jgi:hypothetical protein
MEEDTSITKQRQSRVVRPRVGEHRPRRIPGPLEKTPLEDPKRKSDSQHREGTLA